MEPWDDWDIYDNVETIPDELKTIEGYDEEWAEIKGYPDYEVSIYGDVYDKVRKKELLQYVTDRGYYIVELQNEFGTKRLRVHRLVAEAFIPNPDNKPEVNHINGYKCNNRVNNLEWCTRLENMLHASEHGLIPGTYNSGSFRKRKVRIVELDLAFESLADCAKFINGQVCKITSCLNGDRHTHMGYHFEEVNDGS